MGAAIIIIFIIGYILIAFEHPIKINKSATAILTGVLCWALYAFSGESSEKVTHQLAEHFGEIAAILFFLLGAMTIVELVDAYQGFRLITDKIKTKNPKALLMGYLLGNIFPFCVIGQPYHFNRDGVLNPKISTEQRHATIFCWDDCYCCKCWRGMVTDRRCYDNHALDRWPDISFQYN